MKVEYLKEEFDRPCENSDPRPSYFVAALLRCGAGVILLKAPHLKLFFL